LAVGCPMSTPTSHWTWVQIHWPLLPHVATEWPWKECTPYCRPHPMLLRPSTVDVQWYSATNSNSRYSGPYSSMEEQPAGTYLSPRRTHSIWAVPSSLCNLATAYISWPGSLIARLDSHYLIPQLPYS
jgi:hypothetical protein